jgi:hypothetical protein
MNMPSKQRLASLAAIIVLAALIIVGGTYLQKQKKDSGKQSENDKKLQVGVKQEPEEKGALATEYPQPLQPQQDKTAKVVDSYNLRDENNIINRNATYTSDKSVKEIYDYYLNLLSSSRDYRIVNKSYTETLANIYANRPGESDVSVLVAKDSETGKTVYSVTYLDKK